MSAEKRSRHNVEYGLVEEVVPLVLEEEVDQRLDDLGLEEGVKDDPAVGEGGRLDKLDDGVAEQAERGVQGAKGELHGDETVLVLEGFDAVVKLGAHNVDDGGKLVGLNGFVIACDAELAKDFDKNAYAVLSITWCCL